jgi:DNA-binding response OmpR family regulator
MTPLAPVRRPTGQSPTAIWQIGQSATDRVILSGAGLSQMRQWRRALEDAGFVAEVEPNGLRALDRARESRPAVVVVSGIGRDNPVLGSMRALCDERLPTRVLALIPDSDDDACERCIAAGADAVCDNACSGRELAARLRALLRSYGDRRRVSADLGHVLGDLIIDTATCTVRRGLTHVPLTHLQFQLLLTLVQCRGRVVSRAELYRDVWECESPAGSRVVDACVVSLRKRIGDDAAHPRYILSIRSAGYTVR